MILGNGLTTLGDGSGSNSFSGGMESMTLVVSTGYVIGNLDEICILVNSLSPYDSKFLVNLTFINFVFWFRENLNIEDTNNNIIMVSVVKLF